MSTPLRIVVVFLLVLGNAIFVAAEYALVTGRRSRLEERAARGGRGAKTALRLMDDPVRFISTVQVGITVSATLLGAIGEPLVSEIGGMLSAWLAVARTVTFTGSKTKRLVLGLLISTRSACAVLVSKRAETRDAVSIAVLR